jgi:hypothetical protein
MGCDAQCVSMYPAAYQRYLVWELKECACMQGAPCHTACTPMDCGAMMRSQLSQACQTCLLAEEQKGPGSQCMVTAVEQDCVNDASCAPLGQCALCCATQMKTC